MNKNSVNQSQEHSGGEDELSPHSALEHGFKLCRAPHRAANVEWGKPHCECGKSHEAYGFTFPERIFTVGGSEGRFFLERSTFALCEYVRADLVLTLKHNAPDSTILYGDGVHDDTEAMCAWYAGEDVYWTDGVLASREPLHPDNPLQQRGRSFSLQVTKSSEASGNNNRGTP